MFSHVMVGVNDLEASHKFYDAVLGSIGIAPGMLNDNRRYFYRGAGGSFGITKPINGEPATHGNGATILRICQCWNTPSCAAACASSAN